MTQRQTTTCDRCGKTYTDGSPGLTLHITDGMRYMLLPCFPQDSVKHFCAACGEAFSDFVRLPGIIAETQD